MSKKKQPEQAENEQTEEVKALETEQKAAEQTPATDWEAKYNELNDRYLRMAAEYDNFRSLHS